MLCMANVLPGENPKLFADNTNLFISSVDFRVLNNNYNYCIFILCDIECYSNTVLLLTYTN